MTLNLGQTLIRAYRSLGEMTVGVATGGSASTVVDSNQINRYKDDTWKGGSLFILRDAAGLSGAPENEFGLITAFAVDSGTFTVSPSPSAAPGSGDTYGFVSGQWPLYTAVQLVNDALRELGDVPLRDTTTIETTADVSEYGGSVSWKRRPPYRIEIQNRLSASFDNQWTEILEWTYEPNAGGTAPRIVFKEHLPVGFDLQVWYQDAHPTLTAYSDYVNEIFDPELVNLAVTKKMLEWRNGILRGADAYLLQKLNLTTTQLDNRLVTHRPWRPRKRPRLLITKSLIDRGGEDYFTTPAPP